MGLKKIIGSVGYFRYLIDTLRLMDGRQKARAAGLLLLTMINSVVEVAGLAVVIPVIYLINDPGPIFNNPSLNRIYEFSGYSTATAFIFHADRCNGYPFHPKELVFHLCLLSTEQICL